MNVILGNNIKIIDMSIFKTILGILKVVLPFLKSAAEKSFKKLPKDQQQTLIKVSQMVEIIKQLGDGDINDALDKIFDITGFTANEVRAHLADYCEQHGYGVNKEAPIYQYFLAIRQDQVNRSGNALKSLWSGMFSVISATVSGIDWQSLLMGLGEYVYRTYVKDKI